MGRIRNAAVASALFGMVFTTFSASPASGTVVLAGDRSLTPGSTVAGADSSIVFTGTGPVSIFGGSNVRNRFPLGTEFAHADSRAGVPSSPIANRPVEGDVVGSYTLTSEFNYAGCGVPVSRVYRFVWHESTWHAPSESGKVAELGVEIEVSPGVWSDYSSLGIHYDIVLVGTVDGLPQYETVVPTTATNGFFCTGASFRQTAHFTAPFGKALMRNPAIAGTYPFCASWVTNTGEPLEFCNDVTLDAPTEESSVLVDPPACTITGTEGADVLRGTTGDDVICGLGGDDRIIAGDGADVVIAGDGADRVSGGTGDDAIDAGAGADNVNGGAGDDAILGGDDADVLNGAIGDDTIIGGAGDDRENGGAGNDEIGGGPGADRLLMGPGDDRAYGGVGADVANGGAGNDVVSGGDGPDTLAGAVGSDLVYGGPDLDLCRTEPLVDYGLLVDC